MDKTSPGVFIDINSCLVTVGTRTMALRYAHLAPTHKKKAVEVLDGGVGGEIDMEEGDNLRLWG